MGMDLRLRKLERRTARGTEDTPESSAHQARCDRALAATYAATSPSDMALLHEARSLPWGRRSPEEQAAMVKFELAWWESFRSDVAQ